MKKHTTLLLISLICLSCTPRPQTEKDLAAVLNTKINFGKLSTVQYKDSLLILQEILNNFEYKSIIYLQDGCQPCYPKFIEWQQKMEEYNAALLLENPESIQTKHTILFVIRTDDYNDFMAKVKRINKEANENCYVVIDSDHEFFINNSDIPNWILDNSILINSENKIKMIGAPWINEDMKELFWKTVNE